MYALDFRPLVSAKTTVLAIFKKDANFKGFLTSTTHRHQRETLRPTAREAS